MMWQIPVRTPRGILMTVMLAGALLLAGTAIASAQQVVVLVDGVPITELDIAQRSKFNEMSTHKTPARQDVIDVLINEILELREAKRFGVDPTDSDVNEAYGNIASNMGLDAPKMTQMLVNGGASEATLKQNIRAQMAWSSLVRGRYKASLEIRDSDVEAQLELHKPEEKNQVGYEYVVRPIIFVVPHGAPDSAYEARKRDADALRARFGNCNEGISFTRALKEVAVRDPINRSSADLQQELRDILDKTEVGHLTPPEQTAEGIQMFAVCSKRESKNDTPGMKKMRDEMFQQKFGAKAKRYLADLRRAAMIEYK
ncbi:MAG TPA: peptidylprolyl isomerase [Xanthobacteraceae bacterium]|nr:peptidylprolyl isomerase [Xanthobacteraceae bacterium]